MPEKLTEQKFKEVLDLLSAGHAPTPVMKMTNLSLQPILAISDYIAIHGEKGKEELYQRLTHWPDKPKDVVKIAAQMIEFQIMTNLAARIVRTIFKCSCSDLDKYIQVRKKVGHPLYDVKKAPITLPASVDLVYLDKIVRAANDGRSYDEMKRKYYADLERVLPNCVYMPVLKLGDFSSYVRGTRTDEIKRFVEYFDLGYDSPRIADLLGISATRARELYKFALIHGSKELAKCNGLIQQLAYTKFERACIVETLDAYNLGPTIAALIFKCGRGQITRDLRSSKDPSLKDVTLAAFPETVDQEWLQKYILQQNPGKSVDELTSLYYETHTKRDPVVLTGIVLSDEEQIKRAQHLGKPSIPSNGLEEANHSLSKLLFAGNSNTLRTTTSDYMPRTIGKASVKSLETPHRKDQVVYQMTAAEKKDQDRIRQTMELKGTRVDILAELKEQYPNRFKESDRLSNDDDYIGTIKRDKLPKLLAIKNSDGTYKMSRVHCVDKNEVLASIKTGDSGLTNRLLGSSFIGDNKLVVEHDLFEKLESHIIYVPIMDENISLEELYDLGLISYTDPTAEASDIHSSSIESNDAADLSDKSTQESYDSNGMLTSEFTLDSQRGDISTIISSQSTCLKLISDNDLRIECAGSDEYAEKFNSIINTDGRNWIMADSSHEEDSTDYESLLLNDTDIKYIHSCIANPSILGKQTSVSDEQIKDLSNREICNLLFENLDLIYGSLNLITGREYIEKYMGKVGRHPHIKIDSDGFDELDYKTQNQAYKYFKDVMHVVTIVSLKKKWCRNQNLMSM